MSNSFDNLKESRLEQFTNFTEWNPNPIVELNRNGDIVYLNITARVQFPTLFSAGNFHPLLIGLIEKIEDMIKGKNELIVYARDVTFSNCIYEQQVFANPEKSSIFIYMSDITPRRLAEDKINKFNKELEERVAERTKELLAVNNELRLATEIAKSAARKAEEANNEKRTFLATMSHEIRTPLNGVIGMTELLVATDLSQEQIEYAKTIRIAGELLLSVINSILDFSKIEAGHMEVEKTTLNLSALLNKTIELLSTQLNHKNIQIIAKVDSEIPLQLKGDSAKISQILNNLISNAIKFTEKGQINIDVTLMKYPPPVLLHQTPSPTIHTLLFEITDTGIGISEEVRQRLFQPFIQADSSTMRKYGGTGLGLAITKRLIEMMGGSISVESQIDKGTTFSFKLPFEVEGDNAK